jgi:hypothetical protein
MRRMNFSTLAFFIILGFFIVLALLGITSTFVYGSSTYPPDQQLTLVTMPSIPRPEYLTPVKDPTFGTTITRVSDQVAFGSTLPELRHMYAKNQPWNADESYVILNYSFPAALLDGRTYQFIRWVRQPSQSVWSNVNPSYMYGTYAHTNKFVRLDIANGDAYTVLHTFREYDKISFGQGEGNLSINDRYAALFGLKDGRVDVLVYDLLNDKVVSRKTQPSGTTIGAGKTAIGDMVMSQSGDYVIGTYSEEGTGDYQGVKLFNRSLTFLRQLALRGGSHTDNCFDSSGSEVILRKHDRSSAIVSVQFSTGKETTILPASKLNHSIHISCQNIRRPGWAYISEFAANPVVKKANYNEVFAVKLDVSGTVQRFAHQHHSLNEAYERQPMGVPNHDGRKVLFASDWDNQSDPVYAYIAEFR